MKKLLTVLFCFELITGFSQSKKDNIKKLLESTGAGKLGVQVMQNMMTTFKQTYTNVPDAYWDDFLKQFNADTLVSIIIPIYDKYYSEEEIKQLSDFYQTPLGKKMIQTAPQIMQESMKAGETWGRGIGQKVYDNLIEKGYIKKA